MGSLINLSDEKTFGIWYHSENIHRQGFQNWFLDPWFAVFRSELLMGLHDIHKNGQLISLLLCYCDYDNKRAIAFI